MKLQFEANQEYQIEAVNAVVDVFDGQPNGVGTFDVFIQVDQEANATLIQDMSVGNMLILDHDQITENTQKVQARNNLQVSESGGTSLKVYHSGRWQNSSNLLLSGEAPLDFSVEMETGTGKTYVYLRTIHELRAKYGFKKFIIVVPSIAIKEGVLKNLEVTKEHFASLYGNPEMDYYVWDSKKRGQARQFATNDTLQIMVLTIDSFARAGNIMRSSSDYGVPIEFIRATNPIVILDEPQNMETDIRKAAIAELNPLCTFRYSATHKNYYNLLYKLDPVAAYDKGLVKKIEVDSIFSEDSFNTAYISLLKIEHKGKNGLFAHIEIDKDDARGLQRQIVKLQSGDDLQDLTGRAVYQGYILDGINAEDETIEFANGISFYRGQKNETLHEDILKYQIERTVEDHFEKEKRLQGQGIKVLSLFFIDKVANYREYTESGAAKGKFAIWFEEAYAKIAAKPKFAGLTTNVAEAVHNGYFSADKKGSQWKDTRGETAADDSTYELIMKDKERLLDVNEPLRFIFSHSALREGWDNPNVFQICTLNETTSEVKKRQEIGRGLRLPVNADGERVRDENINILTVIANESYEDFSRKLQIEIEDETGVAFRDRIKNKASRTRILLTKNLQLDESFQALWNKIKYKTHYNVEFDSDQLILEAAKLLADVTISKPKITSRRTLIDSMGSKNGFQVEERSNNVYQTASQHKTYIPDVLSRIQKHTKLTRQTIRTVLITAGMLDKVLINPEQVIEEVVRAINQAMQHMMVDGIKYELTGQEWDMQLFENKDLEKYLENLVPVQDSAKTVYDYVPWDSDIEKQFVHDLETNQQIRFYVKLPGWFTIDTPLGKYNPDWAIVFEDDERIYFVAETKGISDINDITLASSQSDRIRAAHKHFERLDIPFVAPTNVLRDTISKLHTQ